MQMSAAHRPPTRAGAAQLLALRQRSIIALAPAGMPVADAQMRAANLGLSGMEAKLRELEIWLAERDARVAGWERFGAIAARTCTRTRNAPPAGLGRHC
jgi:hypothetical protein